MDYIDEVVLGALTRQFKRSDVIISHVLDRLDWVEIDDIQAALGCLEQQGLVKKKQAIRESDGTVFYKYRLNSAC